ncbi:class I SAM-dependent methyltransferase [Chamaesiphon sp. VAR_48_metabat_403]|uniref:class I SAM-dependent methyltransferase n=1 Tax=Chamaesiphon sp. VAR_48_metabat_403 TaxID=2964700 RepID=UPI00286E5674|nr:class I SAM-dependent methyltransferase [Chamaesiphon sp. VAR_48_metabat_403]
MSKPLPQSPSGFTGKLFGKLMEWTNAAAYQKVLQALAPSNNERFLEIGFGTGRFCEMLLSATTGTFVAGIDPTETMVETALNRLIKKGSSDRIDIRQGTDDSLPWDDDRFDGIIAIHCFQFWQDPDLSIAEISRVLRPQGRIIIAFRDHSTNAPDWLPNPISRSGREVENTISLLEKHGYKTTEYPAAGSSRILRAVLIV